jgi:hypothetical protein
MGISIGRSQFNGEFNRAKPTCSWAHSERE